MKKYEVQLYWDVVSSLLEKSLLDIDLKVLIEADRELKRYHLTFDDALENPDEICSILQRIMGNSYSLLVRLINREMEQVPRNVAYDAFLAAINGKSRDVEASYEYSSRR